MTLESVLTTSPDLSVDHLVSEALAQSEGATAYFVSKALAREFPDRYVLEADGNTFGLTDFAATGRCSVTPKVGPHTQFKTYFHNTDYPLTVRAIQAWQIVIWEEHEIEVIRLRWPSGFCETLTYWIIAVDREVAEAFYFAVCSHYADLRGSVLVFEQGRWNKSHELYNAIQRSSYDQIILAGDLKEKLHEDFERFFASRETYERYGVPWKRGALLIGPAGNGKTQMVKALIKAMHVTCLYVKSLSGDRADGHVNMRAVFDRAREITPCVLVLEDLDSLVNSTNRSYFLNELDGFAANTGIVVLATTNHPERLDPAILDRPSRFDRKYHFNLPGAAERASYLQMWNSELEPELRLTDAGVAAASEATDGFSFAYLKELMLSCIMSWIDRSDRVAMDSVALQQVASLRAQMAYMTEETPSISTELYDVEESEEKEE